jgi:organic radical activating enzyme
VDFGWDNFILSDSETKKNYVRSLLYTVLYSDLGDTLAATVAHSQVPAIKNISDVPSLGMVDHQSVPILPREFGERQISLTFFKELKNFLLRDDVVIYGGNDNEERHLPSSNVIWHNTIPKDEDNNKWITRQDNKWWVLFNKDTGLKVTLSFDEDAGEYVKASKPELIDLKITNCCPYGCKFCYQGSTHQGAPASRIEDWVYAFAIQGVFEVAIGGGEPTLHPEFLKLLTNKASCSPKTALGDITINFTTRNFEWLQVHADLVQEACGAVAISIDTAAQAERYIQLLDRVPQLKKKCVMQYVMSVSSDWEFKQILSVCAQHDITITLLGYKVTGRGASAKKTRLQKISASDFKLQETLAWVDAIKDCTNMVAIDTVLAAQLPKDTFPEWRVRRLEGTHSMYIDAVESTAGISSYNPETYISTNKSTFIEDFQAL